MGFAVLCVAAPVAFAQSAPHLSANTFELGGFAGASYGLDSWRVMGGGNVTYGVTRWLLPYGEVSYFPGITRERTGTFGTTGEAFAIRFQQPITDFHGGVHIRMPIRESKFVPYLVFGLGVLRSSGTTYTATFNVPGSGQETITQSIGGSTDFAYNGGGGLRYYVDQRFGFRLEAKVYKPSGAFTNAFGKVEGGFFIQLR